MGAAPSGGVGELGDADTPAPGASVRDTSAFSGSTGALDAGLSADAWGGVGGA
jgi:hypothetical protein